MGCFEAAHLKALAENSGCPKTCDSGKDIVEGDAKDCFVSYNGPLPPLGCPAGGYLAEPCQTMGEGVVQGNKCCYSYCQDCVCGRPFVVDGHARTAAATATSAWISAVSALAPKPSGHHQALAAAWRADAMDEHASVASFFAFGMELLACGAPPALVAAAAQAAAQEVAHAQLCLALATRLDGQTAGPGALDCSGGGGQRGLAELAAATVREGCVGETIAAAHAATAASHATEPAVREALRRIADDEAGHAELAWRFVAWALATGDAQVRVAVTGAFAELLGPTARFVGRHDLVGDVPATLRAQWGRLGPDEADQVTRATLRLAIAPCAARLLTPAVPA